MTVMQWFIGLPQDGQIVVVCVAMVSSAAAFIVISKGP